MIAVWMLYCLACAALLAGAALVAERLLLGVREPTRLVWAAAIALSLGIPVLAAFRVRERAGVARSAGVPSGVAAGSRAVVAVARRAGRAGAATFGIRASSVRRRAGAIVAHWRARAARLDRPLALGWVGLTLLALGRHTGGLLYVAHLRRRWRRRTVRGVPVLVSVDEGPALVGVVRPAIVLPSWALELEPASVDLMLRHEREHQRAGDPGLLFAARAAAVLMPWNVALWWMLHRLRLAVEMDCDARVLHAAPDVRAYGSLLLDIGGRVAPRSLLGAPALADRAEQLERRIVAMTRRPRKATRDRIARAFGAALVGTAAVGLACASPTPRLAPRPAEPRASDSAAATAGSTPARAAAARGPARRAAHAATTFARTDTAAEVASLDAVRARLDSTRRQLDSIAKGLERVSTQRSPAWHVMTPAEMVREPGPGCGISPSPRTEVQILVAEADAAVVRHASVTVRGRESTGAEIRLRDPDGSAFGATCSTSGTGLVQLFGRGAEAVGVTVAAHDPASTSLVVVTETGRVLAGPYRLDPSIGTLQVSWGGGHDDR